VSRAGLRQGLQGPVSHATRPQLTGPKNQLPPADGGQ
jgi:hypothetical protein